MAAAVVQLDGSVLIWHMDDGVVFNGLLFICGALKKIETAPMAKVLTTGEHLVRV
jgi:hypothetical protein